MRSRIPYADMADFILLGIFGVAALRHIKMDCEIRRLAKQKLEHEAGIMQAARDQTDLALAARLRVGIVRAAMDGCSDLSTPINNSKRHD
jgi:hypothetical protein